MTITNKCDLQYTISNLVDNKGNQLRLSDCDSFVAKFYTDKQYYSLCTKLNDELYNIKIEDEDIALINSDDLGRMNDGVLNFEFSYSIPDKSYADGTYDNTIIGNTNYYIKLNNNTDDIDLSDYYTKNEVYNKIEVDEKNYISSIPDSFATKDYVDDEINKIPSTDLSNYYDKTETYNKTEVDVKIDSIQTGDVDLSGYYNKTETNTLLNNKVDKAEGKQLSSNDYTNEEAERIMKEKEKQNEDNHK